MKNIQHSDKIWTIDNFLSGKECQDLIFFSETKGYEEATVGFKSGAKMMKNIRNNYRLVYQDEKLASQLWHKLKDFCPSKIEGREVHGLNPRFRFYKYESAQRFKRHIDGKVEINHQGYDLVSEITFLIYLNDDFEGGQTAFDEIEIQAQEGTSLCFFHHLKHEGKPILEGTKYVLRSDIFYREN